MDSGRGPGPYAANNDGEFLGSMVNQRLRVHRLGVLLADNDQFQSYQATNIRTGESCFIKIASDRSETDPAKLTAVLERSYRNQGDIRSAFVNRAISKFRHEGHVYVEYPYLDSKNWQVLTEDIFILHLDSLLTQMAVIIDYLHLLGLVHCDIKLGNFMVTGIGDSPRLKLIDMDFLRRAGAEIEA